MSAIARVLKQHWMKILTVTALAAVAGGVNAHALIAVVVGYVTPLLVSLALHDRWSDQTKFTVAIAIAGAAAAAEAAITGWSIASFTTLFGVAFAAQQITWHLNLPGAGDEDLNHELLAVGAPLRAPTHR